MHKKDSWTFEHSGDDEDGATRMDDNILNV